MQQTILITAEALGATRDSHAKWLYLLLRTQLQSSLETAEIIYKPLQETLLEYIDLVIGFELSAESMIKIDDADKVYIDLRISPIRFMDDIFFSFETNSDTVRTKLQQYQVDKSLCQLQANIVMATVIKTKKDQTVLPNSLLLIGQTEADRVLYDGKKYLSLLDRMEEIKQIATEYDHIYLKSHPYAKNNRYLLRELRKGLGEVLSVHDNIYHLLGNDSVQHIAALNSSVLYEATYFNKKTTFLFNPTFTDKQVGIYRDYLGGAFWSDILSPVLQTVPSSLQLPFQASRIRKALNDFWAYNEISDDIVLKNIIKSKIKNFISKYIR